MLLIKTPGRSGWYSESVAGFDMEASPAGKGVPFGEKEHVMADIDRPPGNRDYFSLRESQERRLAAGAGDCAVRSVHLRMADRYAALVREEMVLAVSAREAG